MGLEFDEIVGGIEDGMITALKTGMSGLNIKTFATYSGDLDTENLTKNLMAFAAACPRVMVSYMNGTDIEDPKTSQALGRPIQYRHDCGFAVIVASNDSRNDRIRRRGTTSTTGAYQMIAKVRDTLSGLSIKKTVVDDEDVETIVPLTHRPLMPVSIEFIARKQNMTAYAIVFDTFFRWKTANRIEAGQDVSEIVIGVGVTNELGENPGNLPGVKIG